MVVPPVLEHSRVHERRRIRNNTLVDPAVAVEELLCRVRWCAVQFGGALNQAETYTKLAVKRLGIVTHDFEPAALRWAFRAKGADNDMATRPDAASDLPDVGSSLLRRGKKMEHRTIMPEVVRSWFKFDFSDISGNPVHLIGGRA